MQHVPPTGGFPADALILKQLGPQSFFEDPSPNPKHHHEVPCLLMWGRGRSLIWEEGKVARGMGEPIWCTWLEIFQQTPVDPTLQPLRSWKQKIKEGKGCQYRYDFYLNRTYIAGREEMKEIWVNCAGGCSNTAVAMQAWSCSRGKSRSPWEAVLPSHSEKIGPEPLVHGSGSSSPLSSSPRWGEKTCRCTPFPWPRCWRARRGGPASLCLRERWPRAPLV